MYVAMKKYVIAAAVMAALGTSQDAASTKVEAFSVTPYLNVKLEEPPEYHIPERYERVFMREASAAGVPLWIVARMAEYESGFNPRAVNDKNTNGTADYGMMQLNSAYLDEFSWRYNDGEPVDPFDVDTSVRVACRYLARLYERTGDWVDAVASYNAGLGRVLQDRALPAATQRYIRHVFRERVGRRRQPEFGME